MRWIAATFAAALLATGATAGEAAQRHGVATATCAHQSFAGFPGAYSSPRNFVAGPLAFVHALAGYTPDDIERFGGFKAPAVLRAGHRARVSIDRDQRANVRLAYVHERGQRTQADFVRFPHTVVFRACPHRRAGSRVDGERVTFWSGFFIIRQAPACIGVNISIDGRRARHRVIPVARDDCS